MRHRPVRRRILITGASSGLGAGLARLFARRGRDLALVARRTDRLDELRDELTAAHPDITVVTRRLDVNDHDAVFEMFADCREALGGLDRVVVNAGVGKGVRIGHGRFDANRQTAMTNFVSALAQCEAAVEIFNAAGAGHLVAVSSVSAFRGLPGSITTYAASKAGLAALAEGIRADQIGGPIAVTTLFPGFIRSEMTDRAEDRIRFMVDTETGCKAMVDAIEREVAEAIVPAWPWRVVVPALRYAPLAQVRKFLVTRRSVATAMLVLLAALSGCTEDEPLDTAAARTAAALAEAWSERDGRAFGDLTTRPGVARSTFSDLLDDLDVLRASVTPAGDPACEGGLCRQRLTVRLLLDGMGEWTYATGATLLEQAGGDWLVEWSPALLHPRLTAGTEMERRRTVPDRASILDRNGRPLTQQRQVYRIGVVPGQASPSSYELLADLVDVDEAGLRERAAAAERTWFVDVITLRAADYRPLRRELLSVPGVSVDPGRLPLTPSSTWGRAVLGSVAPATAETLRNAPPLTLSTDYLGSSGLQAEYEEQLAGTPGGRVLLVDDRDDDERGIVWRQPTVAGEPLTTTLSYEVQDAGERAVARQQQSTTLVAVDARTGQVLADVNGPEITSYDTGLVGQFPPGSTFKVVATAALIAAGQDVDDSAACPSATVVGGRRFDNYDATSLDPGSSFADAIAASCNTTVVDRAERLSDDALAGAAAEFGIGADWGLPLPAYSGSVPVADGLVDRAASMIGQGRVLTSPLAMALVAATVASGQAHTPALVPGRGGEPVGDLPTTTVADLQRIMRLVVTEGTAESLRGLPGGVAAKTGTAEYGGIGSLRTHGWLIGYRGYLAFACIVVGGEGGNSAAGPVVRRFLQLAPSSW